METMDRSWTRQLRGVVAATVVVTQLASVAE